MNANFPVRMRSAALALAAAGTLALGVVVPAAPASAQITVFDPSNYTQNLLTAARTLEQINNQIASLQNQASMLLNQAKNLKSVSFPELEALNSALEDIDRLMGEARNIGFDAAALDHQFAELFPHQGSAALGHGKQLAAARARLDAAMDAHRQAMRVQARVAGNVSADAELLQVLAARSQGAEGALQAAQTANQLLALSAKQQFQIENLMAAQFRAQATEAARRAQAEMDGRIATQEFLGTGKAYSSR